MDITHNKRCDHFVTGHKNNLHRLSENYNKRLKSLKFHQIENRETSTKLESKLERFSFSNFLAKVLYSQPPNPESAAELKRF